MDERNTEKQQKTKKKGDLLLTLVLIIAIAVFCYAAFNLFHIYTEYKKGTDEYNHCLLYTSDRSGISTKILFRVDVDHPPTFRRSTRVVTEIGRAHV